VDAILLKKYGRIMCYVRKTCLHHQKSTTTTINSSSQVASSGSGRHTIDGTKAEILASSRRAPNVAPRGTPKARKEEYGA